MGRRAAQAGDGRGVPARRHGGVSGLLGRRHVGPALAGTLLACGLVLGAAPAAALPHSPVAPLAPGPTDPTPPPATATSAPPASSTAAPGSGEAPRYVALGDSWAAGSAAGDLDPAAGSCRRSRAAYPALVARAAGEARWLSRACAARDAGSGNTQFSSLTSDVRAVTATVGADAVGLGELMRACSNAGTVDDCDAAATRAEEAVGTLPPTLDAAIAELRREAPRAAITFLGFPLPAEGAACRDGAADTARARRVDAVVTRLDAVLLERVETAGMRFVDVRVGFAGHGVCAAAPWLTAWNAPDGRIAGGPNAAGHAEGYRTAAANAVIAALDGPSDITAPPPTSSTDSSTPPPTSTAPLAADPVGKEAPTEPDAPGEEQPGLFTD